MVGLNLQLAEVEEKPKRSGDFETAYKKENGKEIVVKRSPDGKFTNKNGNSTTSITNNQDTDEKSQKTSTPPLIEPEADKAIRQVLTGIGNATLQKSLINDASQPPGVIEGIKNTKIEAVIKGSSDAFSNAVAFMRSKIDEAATVVSENKKEIAIGAAVVAFAVAFAVASAGATAVLNAVAIRAGLTTVLGLLRGSSFPDALILGLKSATPEKIKALVSQKIYALAIGYRLGIIAYQEINKQVEAVKLAKSGG